MAAEAESVLDHLHGWELENPGEDQTDVTHVIAGEEVSKAIDQAKKRAAAHIGLEDISKFPETFITDEAVATWAAGLLWNKKIQKVTENKEESDPTTYGDKKIAEAKALLKNVNTDPTDDEEDNEIPIGVFTINGDTE